MNKFILPIACVVSFCLAPIASAQRPTAPRLFTQKTLAYIRADDTRDLKEKMSLTSSGRMMEDPKIKPIINSFYSTLTSSVEGLQQVLGLNLDELLAIPNGELAFALIPTKKEPCACLLLEAGDELPAIELMLSKIDRIPGAVKTKKQVGKIDITTISNGDRQDQQAGYFMDSGVLVACSNAEYIETLALIWTGNGIDHKSLADNRDFTTIMSRCVGTEGERPQVSFFVDPISLFRELSKSNSSSMIALAGMKTLGIDGIKAIGGSAIFAPNEFDSIVHGHLLLDNNRRGVLRAIRPKSGSTDPESWVADNVISYTTLNWDIPKTIKAVAEIVDTFGGENAFENNVIVNGSKFLGIDLRKDFIDLIDDRISIAQTIVPPKKLNSQSNVYAIHVKEPNRVSTEVIPMLFENLKKRDAKWTTKVSGDITIYFHEEEQTNRNIRLPQPAMAVVDKSIMFADSINALEDAIKTESSGDNLLSDAIEFKLVRDRIKAQLKDSDTSILIYQRPEESLRLFYDLARDPENISSLEKQAENNPFFKALVAALKGHELPPFETISKYLAPSGAFVVDEDNGLHYTQFGLRRE